MKSIIIASAATMCIMYIYLAVAGPVGITDRPNKQIMPTVAKYIVPTGPEVGLDALRVEMDTNATVLATNEAGLRYGSTPYADRALDVSHIAEAVYHEARGESKYITVANVVINRMAAARYPDVAGEVINQSYQFSYTLDNNPPLHKEHDLLTYHRFRNEAKELLHKYATGTLTPQDDLTGGALFYYNPAKVKSKPNWVDEDYHTVTHENHKFYNNDKKA